MTIESCAPASGSVFMTRGLVLSDFENSLNPASSPPVTKGEREKVVFVCAVVKVINKD